MDKEEIGSDGVTGMQSRAFDTFMADLCRAQDVLLDECFENSVCLSADVCNAFDPNYPEVSESATMPAQTAALRSSSTRGARGKSGTSDATAELMARIRCIFDKAGVIWQTGQLGKVDQGGGGTVAMYLANRNIDTVDAGVRCSPCTHRSSALPSWICIWHTRDLVRSTAIKRDKTEVLPCC